MKKTNVKPFSAKDFHEQTAELIESLKIKNVATPKPQVGKEGSGGNESRNEQHNSDNQIDSASERDESRESVNESAPTNSSKGRKLLRVKSLKKRSLVAHYVPEVFSSRCKRKTIRVGRAGQGRVNGAATSDSISAENEKEEGKKKRTPYKYSPKPGNRYNPWICYVSLYRHKVQERHPNATNKELIKILSRIYKEIPAEKKKEWEQCACKKRDEYMEELKADDNKKLLQQQHKIPPTPFILFQKRRDPKSEKSIKKQARV